MAVAASIRSNNSTTGRVNMRLLGLGLRAVGALRPDLADELAADLFCRPARGPLPREPRPRDVATRRFSMAVGGRQLAVWDWGEGETVLLAHGWNGHAGNMEAFVAPLVESGHYVAALDLPAHGRSEGRLTAIPEMAAAIEAVARRVGPVKAVVGHSLGATAAALALYRGLRAERAVLIAPAGEPRTFLARFSTALGLGAERTRGLAAAMERRVGPMTDLDVARFAPSQRAPLLVVHDPADREVPFAHGKAIADAWPGSRLMTAATLGHRRLLADREVVREVVRFVRGEAEGSLARSA